MRYTKIIFFGDGVKNPCKFLSLWEMQRPGICGNGIKKQPKAMSSLKRPALGRPMSLHVIHESTPRLVLSQGKLKPKPSHGLVSSGS